MGGALLIAQAADEPHPIDHDLTRHSAQENRPLFAGRKPLNLAFQATFDIMTDYSAMGFAINRCKSADDLYPASCMVGVF